MRGVGLDWKDLELSYISSSIKCPLILLIHLINSIIAAALVDLSIYNSYLRRKYKSMNEKKEEADSLEAQERPQ